MPIGRCAQCVNCVMHAGRGLSGYRGISYEKGRKKAWRIKVGKKTVSRFSHLREACCYVADHKHELYQGEYSAELTAGAAVAPAAAVARGVSPSVQVTQPESDSMMVTEIMGMGAKI